MSLNNLPILGDPVASAAAARKNAGVLNRVVQSIDGNMVMPNTITADNIAAHIITSEEIDVQNLLSNLLVAGTLKTADKGSRIEIVGGASGGIFFYDPSGTIVISMSTADGSALFTGQVKTQTIITAGGGVQFSGTSNVQSGASIIFAPNSGVADPVSPPTVQASWNTLAWSDSKNDRWGGFYDAAGYNPAGGTQPTIVTATTFGSGAAYSATRVLAEYDAATLTLQRSLDFGANLNIVGAVRIGTKIYCLFQNTGTGVWFFTVLNQSDWSSAISGGTGFTGSPIAAWKFNDITGGASSDAKINNTYPGMFYDGSLIWVIAPNTTGGNVAGIKLMGFTAGGIVSGSSGSYVGNLTISFNVQNSITELSGAVPIKTGGGVGQVGVDAGVLYISCYEENNTNLKRDGIYAFDLTSLARLSNLDFGAPSTGDRSYGSSSVGDGAVDCLVYDGSNMWSSVYGGNLGQHTNEYWYGDGALVFGYTWYDGTHESMLSPTVTMTGDYGSLPARSIASVTGAARPSGVDRLRWYVGTSSARSNMHFQDTGVTLHITDNLLTYNAAGSIPPALTNFPASSPGVLVLPVTATGQRPASPAVGTVEVNSDLQQSGVGSRLGYYDGGAYVPVIGGSEQSGSGAVLAQRLQRAGLQTNQLIAQAFPIESVMDGTARLLTNQRLEMSLVWLPAGATITRGSLIVSSAGVGTVTFFAQALYSVTLAGVLSLVASTNGNYTAAVGEKTTTFTNAYTVPADGFFYVGALANLATTAPSCNGVSLTTGADAANGLGWSTTLPRHIILATQTSFAAASGTNVSTFNSTATTWIWQGLMGRLS